MEITYSKGQTLQIRQFEPVNVHFSAKATVAEGETVEEAYAKLIEIVNHQVEVMVTMLQKPHQVIRAKAEAVIKKESAVEKEINSVPF